MKTIEEAKKIFTDYIKENYSAKVIGKNRFFDLLFNKLISLGEYGYFTYKPLEMNIVKWIKDFSLSNNICLVRTDCDRYVIAGADVEEKINNKTFAILREELEQTLTVFRENFSITYSENIAVYTLSLKKDLLFIITLNNDTITVLDTFTSDCYTCLRVSDVQERIFEITKSKIRMELSK